MTLEAFRRRVREEFGPGMERATPANIREFLDRMQQELAPPPVDGTFTLSETEGSVEAIFRSFFSEVLAAPRDQAVIRLWLLALELAFADLEETIEAEVSPLFSPWEQA